MFTSSTDNRTQSEKNGWIAGTDIGGTFTDITLLNKKDGTVLTGKILTTPDDPGRAIFNGLVHLAEEYGVPLSAIETFIHGTTLVANTLIERKGAVTGLITTQGYRDVIEIGSEMRYDIFDLELKKAPPLVPRRLRAEVAERIDSEGNVLVPLRAEDVVAAAKALAAEGVTAIAVAFLNAYLNPEHEKAAAGMIAAVLPGVTISISSAVAPEIREFERFSTTAADAYVKPLIQKYMGNLQTGLDDFGGETNVNIVLSNGGMTSADLAAQYPIRLVESGPAAGVISAAYHGWKAGEKHVIAFDMGGTTAKMCLVQHGEPVRAYEFEASRLQRFKKGSGIPLRIPVIDMIEIGAGGGSIAHIDNLGMLKVGPESAGSEPGPASYGRGGGDPVVTDADLLLGYLDPDYFLGGEMPLHPDKAKEAIESKLCDALKLGWLEAASGIHDIVNNNMASAARIHMAEKGVDSRNFALVATGGAGPVHAYGIARLLGLRKLVCPPASGVGSAVGMLVAAPMVEFGQSYVSPLERLNWSRIGTLFSGMREKAEEGLLRMDVPPGQIRYSLQVEMRYAGQGYEIKVPFSFEELAEERTDRLVGKFETAYRSVFGHCPRGVGVELISLRLKGEAAAQVSDLHFKRYRPDPDVNRALKGTRMVYFPEKRRFVETRIYDRYRLTPGTRLRGPLVIEEKESTVVAGPHTDVRIDDHLNVVIDLLDAGH